MRGLKSQITVLAVLLTAAFVTHRLAAQQSPHPAFSSDAQAERIPNLDSLKK